MRQSTWWDAAVQAPTLAACYVQALCAHSIYRITWKLLKSHQIVASEKHTSCQTENLCSFNLKKVYNSWSTLAASLVANSSKKHNFWKIQKIQQKNTWNPEKNPTEEVTTLLIWLTWGWPFLLRPSLKTTSVIPNTRGGRLPKVRQKPWYPIPNQQKKTTPRFRHDPEPGKI